MKTKELTADLKLTDLPKKLLLGYNDKKPIYLTAPNWDCGWYWSFGYLGNKDCHYHVNGLKKQDKYNFDKKVFEYTFYDLHEGLKVHFGDTFIVKDENDIWTLAELFETFYALKETAEILGRGGSHLTTNPCAKIILNKKEVKRINEVVLPAIFIEIYKILLKY